jgi:hypothetical protein
MSLPARERRRLSGIQAMLNRSDPQLVSLFATFSRLSQEEEMPPIERLRVRVDRLRTRTQHVRRMALTRFRLILIAPVALAATCAALLIGGWSNGPNTCKARPAFAHSMHRNAPGLTQGPLCRPLLMRAGVAGR